METIENQILSALNSKDFLTYLNKRELYKREDRKLYAETIASLHNQGKLNAIIEFEKANRSDESYDFFIIKYIFEDVLPLIQAPVVLVIGCVKHLVFESGEDMSAGMLITPFIRFCESRFDRPQEVLTIALTNYDERFDLIAPALIAGSNLDLLKYVEKSIELSQHENSHIRIKSIHVLGNINYQNNIELIQQAFEAIRQAVSVNKDGFTFATAIRSVFSLFAMNNAMLEEVIDLMTRILEQKDDQVLYVLSEILWLNHGEMPLIMIELFLKKLTNVNPQHKGTINNIDHALSDLLKKGHTTQVIDFIEKVLINNSQLSIKQFDSFIREISQNDALLNSLITRWFLSKRIRFGRCASDLIREHGDNDYILSVDLVQIQRRQAGVHYYLAKKACGWFFINPISAASLMISLIDSAPEEEVQAIGKLLFNPLLISYSGDLRIYINEVSVQSSEKVQKVLSEAIINTENYHNDLRSALNIAELRPSQIQRETYYRHHRQLMDESFKNAPKGLLSQLFKPSVLLYGNRSIHYIQHGRNGEKTRQEVPLQSISHSIELPSLDYLNPHGLDGMLRSFKLEGCTS